MKPEDIEQRYTKDQIFELYLNDIYLGNGIYGIGTAAEYYFDEPASKLSLAQGATLAGMIRRLPVVPVLARYFPISQSP